MSKNKKEIIDNEEGTMAEFLKNALQDNHGQVSIATGYFNVEGYADLRDPLREAAKKNDFHFRLLIGNEAVVRKDAAMECEAEAEGSLPEELEQEQEKGKILELAGFQQDAFSSSRRILAKPTRLSSNRIRVSQPSRQNDPR
jgi:hypothetical protein